MRAKALSVVLLGMMAGSLGGCAGYGDGGYQERYVYRERPAWYEPGYPYYNREWHDEHWWQERHREREYERERAAAYRNERERHEWRDHHDWH